MQTSPRELAEALASVAGLLAALDGDLDRMPGFKRGTKWHLDRVQARQDLLAQRDRLRARQRQLAELN
jgi:hypothetical protein